MIFAGNLFHIQGYLAIKQGNDNAVLVIYHLYDATVVKNEKNPICVSRFPPPSEQR